MATFDLEALTAPVEPDDACGPDFDLAGDSDYLNFTAGTEGRLPLSYFDGKDESGAGGRPFQFAKVDVDGIVEAARPLLAKTRDIRLLFLLSKVSLLGRELGDFVTVVRAVAKLLAEHWDEIHPRAEDGDWQARMVALESIDVQPTVIMPLQFAPLIVHRRFGAVSFRNHLIATGAMPPRDNEDVVDSATIDKIIGETDLAEMVAKRAEFLELQAALQAISSTWSEKADSGSSVDLGKISEIVGRIVVFLDDAIKLRDPSAGLVPPEAAADSDAADDSGDGAVRAGRVTNVKEAGEVLTAVADYFGRREPSSPTLLLVSQANQLLGKSFIEVMRVLVPNHVEHAAIDIGRTESFALPVERLSASAGEWEVAAVEPEPEIVPEEPAAASGDAAEPEAVVNGEAPAEAPAPPAHNGAAPARAPLLIQSRNAALAHLDMVAAYFRAAEPSSPIPFLIERARDLAQRDFLSVLKAILPADTLKTNGN
jgi:type VI secretion system protein ImpA